jgi:hypothetical protein
VTLDEREAAIQWLAIELSGAVPASPLSALLFDANGRAGWERPSSKAPLLQVKGGKGRGRQLKQNMAVRRILVACCFKKLPKSLQAKPKSRGTAQAIIGRLQGLQLKIPSMAERTIQEDIRVMQKNGNFGI